MVAQLKRIKECERLSAWMTMWQPCSSAPCRPPFPRDRQRDATRGLANRRITAHRQAFKITVRDLGDLKPALSLDNVAELIEQLEGSPRR